MASRNAPAAKPAKKVKLSGLMPANIKEQLEKELNAEYFENTDNGNLNVFGYEYK